MDFLKLINENKNFVFAFIIVVIFILILFYHIITYNIIKRHLNGTWSADAEFLNTAKLDSIVMYIDNDVGYLLIMKDGKEIYNDGITLSNNLMLENMLTYSFSSKLNPSFKCYIPEMKDEWTNDENYYMFNMSMIDNSMEITNKDGDTLYCYLHRMPIAQE